jgi:hypothetical protein
LARVRYETIQTRDISASKIDGLMFLLIPTGFSHLLEWVAQPLTRKDSAKPWNRVYTSKIHLGFVVVIPVKRVD